MLKKVIPFLILFCECFVSFSQTDTILKVVKGSVSFTSKAPLEVIEAQSASLKGLLNISKRTFAFKLSPSTFEGFNASLQKEHFNENFMESEKFPMASFSGKIIDELNLSSDEEQTIRAKGILSIHGVDKERILKVQIKKQGGSFDIRSSFIVPLKDHNISIPRVVHQKISEEINVEVQATMSSK